jgi:hypothetical protein
MLDAYINTIDYEDDDLDVLSSQQFWSPSPRGCRSLGM